SHGSVHLARFRRPRHHLLHHRSDVSGIQGAPLCLASSAEASGTGGVVRTQDGQWLLRLLRSESSQGEPIVNSLPGHSGKGQRLQSGEQGPAGEILQIFRTPARVGTSLLAAAEFGDPALIAAGRRFSFLTKCYCCDQSRKEL